MKKPDVIIFGVGNYNSLGVLHCLSDARIPVFILNVGNGKDLKNGNIILYSKWAKQYHCVRTEEEGVNWILDNSNFFKKGTIIIPTSDTAEKLLDQTFSFLSPHFKFPNIGKRKCAVSVLMDKKKQIELANTHGIRIIESQYTSSHNFSYEKVKYPCMVKPLDSTNGSKDDMRVCYSEEELREALSSGKKTSEYIVQQYINNESDLLFLGVANEGENPYIPAVVIKPGVSPTGEYTHAIVSTDIKSHLDKLEQVNFFIKSLNYTGPFSIEFGLEKGKNYFFEVNLRNDGTSHYPLNLGINLAEILYRTFKEGKIPRAEVSQNEYEMIDETGDIRRILNGEISISEWIKSFRNAGIYRYYIKGDKGLILPLINMFIRRLCGKLKRIVHL